MTIWKGVDTRKCAILAAATGLGDPIYCGNEHGSPYYSVYYRKVTKSPLIFAKVTCHGGFSGEVTQSQPNFRQSQIVTRSQP